MSLKRKLENGISSGLSVIGLLLRRIIGNTVQFAPLTLVSIRATLRTYNNGSIRIGRRTAVRENTEIAATAGYVEIGNDCFINRNCMIVAHERIQIGDGTTIGPGVSIYDHDHDGAGGYNSRPITIGKNVWIGAGCILLKGVTVGDDVVVGAGTLVTTSINSSMIAYEKRTLTIRNAKRTENETNNNHYRE